MSRTLSVTRRLRRSPIISRTFDLLCVGMLGASPQSAYADRSQSRARTNGTKSIDRPLSHTFAASGDEHEECKNHFCERSANMLITCSGAIAQRGVTGTISKVDEEGGCHRDRCWWRSNNYETGEAVISIARPRRQ